PDFIDYALARAKKTRFDVQTLGGLRQYLPQYLERRVERAADRHVQAARKADERATELRIAYDRFRRERANQIFATLQPKERDEIERQAQARTPSRRGGLLAQTMFELEGTSPTGNR